MATTVEVSGDIPSVDEITKSFENQDLTGSAQSGSPPSLEKTEGRKNVTEDGRQIMFVAGKSRVKQVAGSISRVVREAIESKGDMPILSAVGAASVNQTVKALAVARDYLAKEGLDIAVEVSRRPQKDVKDVLLFDVSTHPIGSLVPEPALMGKAVGEETDYIEMKASSKSATAAFAGAISSNVREGKKPRITAVGAKAVFQAIRAVALARRYVWKESLDLDLVPSFTDVSFEGGEEAKGIQIIVIPRKILSAGSSPKESPEDS